ncbi:hypothetical protein [Roseospira navarrensis]|uniref:Uncharacterized protein n=1 Tax=Roseospira navarrensis TaxID=140058 RepID=A0A7X1ZDF0_9PROT|nr:hypothetical protein [Roseospira navarrensis]MQX35342.1 hypothetical protein [Roseospira navarrensis]
MSIDAVGSDHAAPALREAPRPMYEGQPYYTFDDVVESFSFWDVLDIFNPLQHIPLVSTLYRELTGDEIGGFARIAGGALYGGGAIGAAVGVANMAFDAITDGGPAQIARGAFDTVFGDDPPASGPAIGTDAAGATTLAAAPLGGSLLTDGTPGGGASAGGGRFAPGSLLMASLARAPDLPGQTAGGGLPNGPLAGDMLTGPAAVAGTTPRPEAVGGDVLTLNTAQASALAAFVAQQSGGARGADPAGRTAGTTAAAAAAGPDGVARPGLAAAPSPSSSPDGQSQDMHQNPDFSDRPDDRDTRQQAAALAMPPEIQRGREAHQALLAEARAAMGAPEAAGALAGQMVPQMAGQAGGAPAPTDSRRTGMTLADYRANPNRRAEGQPRPFGTTAPAGGGRAVSGVLPDAATMAGLMERGETLATAVARQGERTTASVQPPVHGAGDLDFRAMPLASERPARPATAATAATTPMAPASGRPVAAQPWFSDRVMDAMRRYDATRDDGRAPAT